MVLAGINVFYGQSLLPLTPDYLFKDVFLCLFPKDRASCTWEVLSHLSVRVPASAMWRQGRLPFVDLCVCVCGGGLLRSVFMEMGISIFQPQTRSSLNGQGGGGSLAALASGRTGQC